MLEHHTLKRVFLNKPCSIYATNLTMTLQVFQNKNTANTIPNTLAFNRRMSARLRIKKKKINK